MSEIQRSYIAIDLKSFYASVECIERGLNPMTTNLVVADKSRTEKTICLAVSPALKSYGIPGRARLFEVIQKVNLVNAKRKREAPGGTFAGTPAADGFLESRNGICEEIRRSRTLYDGGCGEVFAGRSRRILQ